MTPYHINSTNNATAEPGPADSVATHHSTAFKADWPLGHRPLTKLEGCRSLTGSGVTFNNRANDPIFVVAKDGLASLSFTCSDRDDFTRMWNSLKTQDTRIENGWQSAPVNAPSVSGFVKSSEFPGMSTSPGQSDFPTEPQSSPIPNPDDESDWEWVTESQSSTTSDSEDQSDGSGSPRPSTMPNSHAQPSGPTSIHVGVLGLPTVNPDDESESEATTSESSTTSDSEDQSDGSESLQPSNMPYNQAQPSGSTITYVGGRGLRADHVPQSTGKSGHHTFIDNHGNGFQFYMGSSQAARFGSRLRGEVDQLQGTRVACHDSD